MVSVSTTLMAPAVVSLTSKIVVSSSPHSSPSKVWPPSATYAITVPSSAVVSSMSRTSRTVNPVVSSTTGSHPTDSVSSSRPVEGSVQR